MRGPTPPLSNTPSEHELLTQTVATIQNAAATNVSRVTDHPKVYVVFLSLK